MIPEAMNWPVASVPIRIAVITVGMPTCRRIVSPAARERVPTFFPTRTSDVSGASPGSMKSVAAARPSMAVEASIFPGEEAADITTPIVAGDRISTGVNSKVIFVDGSNAHILRESSAMQLPGESGVANLLRVVTGALLSVLARSEQVIATPTATVGIRGTGVYVEADPDESYICTCFGMADLIPVDAPVAEETVTSEHHDAPRFATRTESAGKRIRVAPFRNHTDLEVALIEELVGRVPPFAFTLDRFDSPINSY